MTQLPFLIRAAPRIFYVAAAIYFLAATILLFLQAGQMSARMAAGPGAPPQAMMPFVNLALLGAWIQAALGALVLAGIGVVCRLLMALAGDRSVSSVFGTQPPGWEDRE